MIIVTIGDIFSRVNDTGKILLFNQIVVQICCKCKTPSVYFIYLFSATWTLTRRKTRKVLKVCYWIFMSLSPPQRPLCVVGKLGRMKWQRKRVGHDGKGKERKLPPFSSSHRPPRAFYFSIIAACIFNRISIESLCRGAESPGHFVLGKIKHFERADCSVRSFGFGVSIWLCLFVCFFSLSYIEDNHSFKYPTFK